MKHLIIRDGLPYSDLVVDNRCKGVPASCQILCTRENLEEANGKVQYRPILAKQFVLKISYDKTDMPRYIMTWAEKPHIRMIIYCKSLEDYESVKVRFRTNNIDFDSFDSYKSPKALIDKYILVKLNSVKTHQISNETLQLIRGRLHGHGKEIIGYLELLARTGCTRADVLRIIPKKSSLTPYNFAQRLFLGENRRTVNDLIVRYRYYPRNLIKNLNDFCKNMDEIYIEVLNGKLADSNYLEWFVDNKKERKLTGEYQVEQYLEIVSRVSYPKFMAIWNLVRKSTSDQYTDLVILFKVVRWLSFE